MCYEFQSTRPRGRTRPNSTGFFNGYSVSIHASSREDATLHNGKITRTRRFNPRVLAGGRDVSQYTTLLFKIVSIHASSREDATVCLRILLNPYLFQSTRPRGRTRQVSKHFGIVPSVSIHASSREDATKFRLLPRDGSMAFQSTRPRGRTRLCCGKSCSRQACFNPRVLAGGRDISAVP